MAKSTTFQAIANAVPKAGGQRALPTTSAQAILETVGMSVSEDIFKKSKKSVDLTAQEHLDSFNMIMLICPKLQRTGSISKLLNEGMLCMA